MITGHGSGCLKPVNRPILPGLRHHPKALNKQQRAQRILERLNEHYP